MKRAALLFLGGVCAALLACVVLMVLHFGTSGVRL